MNQGEILLDEDNTVGGVFSEEHAQENVLSMADGELQGATTTTFA